MTTTASLSRARQSCFAIAAVAALCLTCIPPAEATEDIMAIVADGRPWTIQMAEGREGTLALNPDGTGTMRAGFMSMDMTWTRQPGGFCMTGGRMGTRCVTLQADGSGYFGVGSDGGAMRLSR